MWQRFFGVVLLAIGLSFVLVSCGSAESSALPTISLTMLQNQSGEYEGKEVSVVGWVSASHGVKSSFILYPYLTPYPCKVGKYSSVCMRLGLSLSEVQVEEFEFTDGEATILLVNKTGGLYIPVPVVPAGSPNLPKGKLLITGVWTHDKEGRYLLTTTKVSNYNT